MPAAYERAKKLLTARAGTVFKVQALGTIEALLILLLLVILGLLMALLGVHGAGSSMGLGAEGGLGPLVAHNESSPYFTHRLMARLLGGVLDLLPLLRDNQGALTFLLISSLALILALSWVIQTRRSILAEAASQAATNLRRQLHRQIYRLGQSALPNEGVGPVVNLFVREVNDVRNGLFAGLDLMPLAPILAGGLLLFALFISVEVSIFLFALGGLVWLTARELDRSARRLADASTRDAALQLSLLQEDLAMLRTVRVFGMEEVDRQRFDSHLERYRDSDARRIRSEWRINPSAIMLFGASVVIALGLLSASVVLADRLSLSSILILPACLLGIGFLSIEWMKRRRILERAERSAAGIFEYIDRRTELQQPVGAQFLPPLADRIRFENVSVSSASGRPVLERVTLEIPARSRTAIMGLDDQPKFALVSLIPRLLDPREGRVTIDGVDLRDATLESIRAQVATVFQNDLVFTDSVRANIGLGDESYTLPRIIEAAKVAHAHSFIQDLPQGYDTIIGPIGHYLSVDQLYRIALARVVLHDPSIVIVEEPDQPLDEEIKMILDDTLARISRNKTMIFLPHRLSTIRSCQNVIVLHEGRIEATGPYRDLHNRSKLFRHLQYIEFNQFASGGEIEAGQMAG